MFFLFRQRRINLNFKKSCLNYSFVILLKQRIDFLNLFISKEKLTIITSFNFLKSLYKIKTFLELIE